LLPLLVDEEVEGLDDPEEYVLPDGEVADGVDGLLDDPEEYVRDPDEALGDGLLDDPEE